MYVNLKVHAWLHRLGKIVKADATCMRACVIWEIPVRQISTLHVRIVWYHPHGKDDDVGIGFSDFTEDG